MTAPRSNWPPTKESLANMATNLDHASAAVPAARLDDAAAFLRDPRLLAALDLWRAKELCGERGSISWDRGYPPFKAWEIKRFYSSGGGIPHARGTGDTLPEAVAALQAKLNEGKEV